MSVPCQNGYGSPSSRCFKVVGFSRRGESVDKRDEITPFGGPTLRARWYFRDIARVDTWGLNRFGTRSHRSESVCNVGPAAATSYGFAGWHDDILLHGAQTEAIEDESHNRF